MAHESYVSVYPLTHRDFNYPLNPFTRNIFAGETFLVRNSGRVYLEFQAVGGLPVDVTIATPLRVEYVRPGYRGFLDVADRVIRVSGVRPAPTGPFPTEIYGATLRITASTPNRVALRAFAR